MLHSGGKRCDTEAESKFNKKLGLCFPGNVNSVFLQAETTVEAFVSAFPALQGNMTRQVLWKQCWGIRFRILPLAISYTLYAYIMLQLLLTLFAEKMYGNGGILSAVT